MKRYLAIAAYVTLYTIVLGSCSYRLGTACGAYDAGMALQTCLKGPPFTKRT